MSGSAFKKVYFDEGLGRQISKFVPSDDLYVPYQTTDFPSCERITHVIRRTENEGRKMQVSGMYRDVDIKTTDNETALQEKEGQISGVKNLIKIIYINLEMVDLNIRDDGDDGIKVPYIVTIDEGSGKVLSIYRNYREDDPEGQEHNILFIINFGLVFMVLV